MKKNMPGFILILVILLIWEFISYMGFVPQTSMPQVSKILGVWVTTIVNGEMFKILLPSLNRIFIGFFLAIIVAVPVGLLMGVNRFVFKLLEPITELMRPIPAAAYIPIAILFFGIGDEMKVFVVFLSCFFPILLDTYGGARGVDPVLIETGRTFGVSRIRSIRTIILPASLPNIFTGMRISLAVALMVTVVSEMVAGNDGIGYYILDSQRIFKISQMFSGVFTLGLLGYFLNTIFLKIEGYFLRWRPEHEE